MTDEMRVIKYTEEVIEFVRVMIQTSKKVVITKTTEGFLVKAEDIKEV